MNGKRKRLLYDMSLREYQSRQVFEEVKGLLSFTVCFKLSTSEQYGKVTR